MLLPARMLLLIVLLAGPGWASDAALDPARLRKCTEEPNDAKRLACYDLEMGRSKSPAGDFGNESLPHKPEPVHGSSNAPNNLVAKVQATTQGAYGKIVVTLDNGQVWEQQELIDFSLRVGDVVTLKPGLLGSFWMTNPSHERTRVSRVK